MITDEIKLIRTKKEGDDLLKIQEDYPKSIIFVDSEKDKNVYIGSDRVEQGYNVGVDGDNITNSVGGMKSGILASELKGKPISEILDIILFASNNNMTLKGVQVVDKIENLTDDTLEEVYQGMVVSVLEDDSLYILLSDSDSDSDNCREWKKVETDIDKDEIKEYVNTLSEPIKVAGLSGTLGANITNDKTYNTIEEILRDLLCKEIYPEVFLSTTNPTLSFGGLKGATASNYQSLMEVGSVLNLNEVTLNAASISGCSRRGTGFTYGYSSANDGEKDSDGNPPVEDGSSSLVGTYSLTETYSPSSIGTVRTVDVSDNCDNVKFNEGSVKIGLGINTISISATSPSGTYTHPEYLEYYVVSNLGNTNENNRLKAPAVNGSLSSITKSTSISVTGVYPVYVNIDSGSFVDEPIKMSLTTSNIFELVVPSEVASEKHFTFDYPATHTISSFEIKDLSGNFVEYSATYEAESETIIKVIGGEDVSYKRLITTGALQGVGTYKITLSKGLDR